MKWSYRVDVGTITGEVEAVNEDEALKATMEDALQQADDAISGGTWEMRKQDETIAAPLEDDVQEVGGEE